MGSPGLTGHSSGFFSVYTLPPNQAVSLDRQRKINAQRAQVPPERDVFAIVQKKSRALLKEQMPPGFLRGGAKMLTGPAEHTPEIADGSVDLIVTSPPFLDVVDYAGDNWLRGWFCGIDTSAVEISMHRKIHEWQEAMTRVFHELARVLKPGGHVAFEVGEVRGGKVKLEEAVLPCGVRSGLQPLLVVINAQQFTKTANCWGIKNNAKGTNTNRIVVFQKS